MQNEGDEGDVPHINALLGMARGQTITQSYHSGLTETLTAFHFGATLGVDEEVDAAMTAAAAAHPPNSVAGNAAAAIALLAAYGIRVAPPPIDAPREQMGPPRHPPPRYQRDEILENFVPEDIEIDLNASPNTVTFTAKGLAAIFGAKAMGYQVDEATALSIQDAVNLGQNISHYSGTLAATFGVNGPIGTTRGNIYAGRGGGGENSEGGAPGPGPGQSPGDPGQSP